MEGVIATPCVEDTTGGHGVCCRAWTVRGTGDATTHPRVRGATHHGLPTQHNNTQAFKHKHSFQPQAYDTQALPRTSTQHTYSNTGIRHTCIRHTRKTHKPLHPGGNTQAVSRTSTQHTLMPTQRTYIQRDTSPTTHSSGYRGHGRYTYRGVAVECNWVGDGDGLVATP